MAVDLPHTSCSWCLQTTWRCCIQKIWCWTFRQKVSLQAVSGKCKEAERKWIVEDVSKGIICWQNYRYRCADRRIAADKLFTGCRSTGIKTTGALHNLSRPFGRLLFGTWEAALLMCETLCRNSGFIWEIVQQKFYNSYCNSILL